MLTGNPDITEVIESSEHPRLPEYKRLIKRIFRKYDLAIITQPSDRAHLYGLLAAPTRVGMIPTDWTHHWWKKLSCTHTVELDYWNQHVVLERLRLLSPFLPKTAQNDFSGPISLIPPSSEPLPREIENFLSSGSTIVIHATPMWRFKRWPSAHWVEVISHLVKEGHNVALTGSSSQQDRGLNKEIFQGLQSALSKESLQRVLDCAGRLSLGQTSTLLKAARLYIGVDTSITHLAAACGTQTVALFGATAPPNFGPWPQSTSVSGEERSVWLLRGEAMSTGGRFQVRGNVNLIQGPGVCVPCRKAGCLDKFESHSDCLENLKPETLLRALQADQKIGAE